MARTNNLTDFLTDVANAIKEKKGAVTNIPAANFDTEILNLPSQGNYEDKVVNITQNGTQTVYPSQNYDAINSLNITTNVPEKQLQMKTYNFTQNVNIELTPDNGYDGFNKIGLEINVAGGSGEDLEAEISAQEVLIQQLQTELAKKTSSATLELNVFTQTTEPIGKDGIWLQINKTPDNIEFVDNPYNGGYWNYNKTISLNAPPITASDVTYNGQYVFIKGSDKTSFYKWDISTDTYEKLPDTPDNTEQASIAAVGNYVYFFGGATRQFGSNNVYKYDIVNKQFIQLTNLPYTFQGFGRAKVIGTDIYLMGDKNFNSDSSQRNTKWDTLTDTYRVMATIPYRTDDSSFAVVGKDIYIIGGGSYNHNEYKFYKYDTLSDIYTEVGTLPVACVSSCTIGIGTDIYMFRVSGDNHVVTKYNITSNTFTTLTPCNYSISGQGVLVGNDIYFFTYDNGSYLTATFTINVVEYSNNSVVIAQGIPSYLTLLIKNEEYENLKFHFNDAFFYEDINGLIDTIPTYYGDGTQWIKFKN